MRLFVAIRLPTQVVAALGDLQQQMRSLAPEADQIVRWTKPGQLHLTLRFFGNVEEQELDSLRVRMDLATVNFQPLNLQLGQCGCFPSSIHPRILWVGLQGDIEALSALHDLIGIQTADFGQAPEDRKFQPHLTLGRLRSASKVSKNLGKKCEKINVAQPASWTANEVQLIQSHLSAEGALYQVIAQFKSRV